MIMGAPLFAEAKRVRKGRRALRRRPLPATAGSRVRFRCHSRHCVPSRWCYLGTTTKAIARWYRARHTEGGPHSTISMVWLYVGLFLAGNSATIDHDSDHHHRSGDAQHSERRRARSRHTPLHTSISQGIGEHPGERESASPVSGKHRHIAVQDAGNNDPRAGLW